MRNLRLASATLARSTRPARWLACLPAVLTTLRAPCEYEEVVKKSRFVAFATPVSTANDAMQFVAERSDPKASHNVFAYKLADGSTRQSSDGEPGGTAGPPVLAAIEGSGLVDVVALVIRYYGGIKLGTGGLVRAYGGAAKQCLDLGEKSEIVRTEAYIISYAHGDTGSVFGLIGGYSPTPISSDDNGGSVLITLPPDELEGFEQRLAEATAGRASIAG